MDEEDSEILDKAIEKAIKKLIEEKQEEIDEDESSDESDNACGALKRYLNRLTRNSANVLMELIVRDVITLSIVQMTKLTQSTDGANI